MSYLACVFASCKQMKVQTIVTSKQLLSCISSFLFCSHPLVVHLYQPFFSSHLRAAGKTGKVYWQLQWKISSAPFHGLPHAPSDFDCSFISSSPSLYHLSYTCTLACSHFLPPSFTNYKPTKTVDRSHLQLKNVQAQAIHSFCDFINAHRVCKLVACTQ